MPQPDREATIRVKAKRLKTDLRMVKRLGLAKLKKIEHAAYNHFLYLVLGFQASLKLSKYDKGRKSGPNMRKATYLDNSWI